MKIVYKISESKFFIETVILNDKEETPLNCVEVSPPDGLYRAKWTGTKWVEDMSQEDINALNSTIPIETNEQKINNLLKEYASLKTRVSDSEIIILELILS